MMRHACWIAMLAGFWMTGCNEPCQTYCDNITDFYNGCVENGDPEADDAITWGTLGAEGAEDYHASCLDRMERTISIARTEDRNIIYDWCEMANMAVASASNCGSFSTPELPDLTNEGDEGE